MRGVVSLWLVQDVDHSFDVLRRHCRSDILVLQRILERHIELANLADLQGFLGEEVIDSLLGEHDENVYRKDFTVTEKAAIGKVIEDREADDAKRRQRESGGDRKGKNAKIGSPKMGEPIPQASKVAAKAVGMSHTTYAKAQEVIELAKEHPLLDAVVEEMDRTGFTDLQH